LTNGSSPPERGPDFQLIRQSTIFLPEPLTDAAHGWGTNTSVSETNHSF
jgi:hypothetical protein